MTLKQKSNSWGTQLRHNSGEVWGVGAGGPEPSLFWIPCHVQEPESECGGVCVCWGGTCVHEARTGVRTGVHTSPRVCVHAHVCMASAWRAVVCSVQSHTLNPGAALGDSPPSPAGVRELGKEILGNPLPLGSLPRSPHVFLHQDLKHSLSSFLGHTYLEVRL